MKAERERKNLTPAEFARRVSISPQYIYNLENNIPTKTGGLPQPSTDVCMRFARVLSVHYLEVLQAAGHTPLEIDETEIDIRKAADYFAALPDEQRAVALDYLKLLFEKFGDAKTMRERAPKHPAVVQEGESHPPPVAKTTPQSAAHSKSSRRISDKQAHSERPAKKRGSNGN